MSESGRFVTESEGAMQIEVLLSRDAPDYAVLQKQLNTEINAIVELASAEGAVLQTQKAAPPPGTLAVDEVFRWVIQHPAQAAGFASLAKTAVEAVLAVVRRLVAKPDPKQPVAIVIINEAKLQVPGSNPAVQRFMKSLPSGSDPANPHDKKRAPVRKGPSKAGRRKPRKSPH
jgi:hypothetical protein